MYEIELRLDDHGFPSLTIPRPLRLISGAPVTLDILVRQLIISSLPPGYLSVDIDGWTARLIGKASVNDDDTAALFTVAGAIEGDSADGRLRFLIDAADLSQTVDAAYGELDVVMSDTQTYRIPFAFTLTKPGLSA